MGLLDNLIGKIEEENPIDTKIDPIFADNMQGILKSYRECLGWKVFRPETTGKMVKLLAEFNVTKKEINEFFSCIGLYQEYPEFSKFTGPFISALIQRAYYDGHNDFNIEMPNAIMLGSIPSMIKGEKENPLRIKMSGDFDSYNAYDIGYAEITFEKGSAKGFACEAWNSKFTFNTDIGSADYSFDMDGSIGYRSRGCEYIFKKDFNPDNVGGFSESCIFRCKDKDKLHEISKKSEYSKYYLIEDDDSYTEVTF